MSGKTSFAEVNRAVLAVDKLQQQMADLTEVVNLLSERLKALEATVPRE